MSRPEAVWPRRQLNGKFLVALLVGPAVLGVGVHLLHSYQVSRQAGALREQASRASAGGRPDRAAGLLARYLSYRPGDTEALVEYGLALDRSGGTLREKSRARLALEQAVAREPGRVEARRELVRMARAEGLYEVALTHLGVLSQAEPRDGSLRDLMGQCYEALGNAEQAAASYREALEIDPGRADVATRLAVLLRGRLEDPEGADRVLDDLVAADPDASGAYLARVRYRLRFDLAGGEAAPEVRQAVAADVARALELAPESAEAHVAAADVARREGDVASARTAYGRALALEPRNGALYRVLASLEQADRRPEAALACLEQGLKTLDGRGDASVREELRWQMAGVLIQAGQIDRAREEIKHLRRSGLLRDPLIDYLEAAILVQQGSWSRALGFLEQLRASLGGSEWSEPLQSDLIKQVDLWTAQCYGQIGSPDQELAAYRRAVAVDGRWMPGRRGLATALLKVGQVDASIAELLTIAPQDPTAGIALVRLLTARNQALPEGQRSWEDIDRLLGDLDRVLPGSVEVLLLRAQVLSSRGRLDEARQVLERGREALPEAPEPWVALAGLDLRAGRLAEARGVLAEAQRILGDSETLRLGWASYWAVHPAGDDGAGQAEANAALEGLTRGLEGMPEEARDRILGRVADAYLRRGNRPPAAAILDRLASRRPTDLGLRLLGFDLALEAGDATAMERLSAEIRAIEGPSGAQGHYAEAARLYVLALKGRERRLDEARRHLAEVARLRPSWARVPVLEGRIAELEGDATIAIASYRKAMELGDRRPAVVRDLVKLLYDRRRYVEADQAIRRLQQVASIPDDLKRLASEVSLESGQAEGRDRALKLAREIVSAGSADAADHVWLGRVLMALGQVDEAEQALRKAVEVAPEASEPRVALVQFLARAGRVDEADRAVAEARDRLPDDQVALTLATCYEAMGRLEQAEEQYQAARAARPGDPVLLQHLARFYQERGRFTQAEPILRAMLEPGAGTPAPQASWARRYLAVGLAMGGDPERLAEALRLVDQNLAEGGNAPEDRRAKAVVLAMQPERRLEAIAIFEEEFRRLPPRPDEQFLLAQLYEASGDWPRARERMLNLVGQHRENATYLSSYCDGLLKHGAADEAALWVDALEKVEPGSPRSVILRARLLKAQGRAGEAVDLVRGLARSEGVGPARAAALLEELGQTAAAEPLYRELATQGERPEDLLALAQNLGRQGKVDEALALCERARATSPPRAVITAAVEAVAAARAGSEACLRVGRWIDEAIASEPDSAPSYLVHRALLRTSEGRDRDAVALYREALVHDGRNVLALNNLAYLLAFVGDRPDEALTLIERAVTVAGRVPELLDTRGVALLMAGRADEAIRDLEGLAATDPKPGVLFHLARAHLASGATEAAAAALDRAETLGLKPEDVDPRERPALQELRALRERGGAQSER